MEKWIATTAYNLESVTAQELKLLGAEQVTPETSRVTFMGEWEMGAQANVWLRTAGKVRLVVEEFNAYSFNELFEKVREIPWECWIDEGAAFPVTARAIHSTLMSVPDIQAITKKAISERLKEAYHKEWLDEDDARPAAVETHIHKDKVTLSLDTSGNGLHMRGYRKLNGPAALRETLAASLVLLTKWQGDRVLMDPFCGTGTIAVEAAMMAKNIAPGLNRSFAAEKWEWVDNTLFNQARKEARGMINDRPVEIIASDIDEQSLSMAAYHAKRAGVADYIQYKKADVRKFKAAAEKGHIITNPPYGNRLGSVEEARELYKVMGDKFAALPQWGIHILSPDDEFERWYHAKAKKRREIYNGSILCRYFEFF